MEHLEHLEHLPERLPGEAPMTWLDKLLAEAEPSPAPEGEDYLDPTLEALCAGLPPEDALDLREERAGILEYEAGLSRTEAELRAGLRPYKRTEAA